MSWPSLSLRSGLVAALVLASLVIASPDSSAAAITARSGDVSATFTYSGSVPQSNDPRLSIFRSGKVVDNVAVRSKWCGHQCWPDVVSPGHSILHVVRLRQHGPLDVVLDLYSGGAHCCTVEKVFAFDPSSGSYKMFEYDFGDPSATLEPLGKGASDVFVSANDSFAYAFTDYAASGMPLEILKFAGNAFHDVTRSFPRLIRLDATRWRRSFDLSAKSHYRDDVGVAAAWAADEEMLGHFTTVQNFLQRQARAGHLNSGLSPFQPSGQKFVAALRAFLRDHGYEK